MRILFAMFAALFLGSSHATEDPVKSFEKLIAYAKAETNAAKPVNFNSRKQLWAKKRFDVAEVSYDVRKTDSLISPIIGIINLTLVTGQTNLFQSKDEAETATEFLREFNSTFKLTLNYAFIDGKWAFQKGSYPSPYVSRMIVDITPETMSAEPTSVPMVALHSWIPK